MINNYFKASLLVALLALGATSCNTEEEKTNDKAEVQGPKLDFEVLEREESSNGMVNLAVFTSTPNLLTAQTAIETAESECGSNCNMIYFYTDKEAYTLHVLKRKRYSDPNLYFNGDMKRMVEAEKGWMAENGNWQKVKDGLKASLFQGEYQENPIQ